VKRLADGGLIAEDPLVSAVLRGEPQVSAVLRGEPQELTTRTEQRRFLQVTGMPRGLILQIERARYATNLLKQGVSILEAAYQAGYYDQAHFSRSLKRWTGQTPAQISRAERQLSFLYNTAPPFPAIVRPDERSSHDT
jgi:hypothetical protein